MKAHFKSIFGIFTSAVILATGALSIPTFADSGAKTTTNFALEKTDFSKKWHKTWVFYFENGVSGSMTVGFDTWFTDEDYVTAFGTKAGKHYAYVINSKGSLDETNTAAKGETTGKADIKHTGSPVTYGAIWHD